MTPLRPPKYANLRRDCGLGPNRLHMEMQCEIGPFRRPEL